MKYVVSFALVLASMTIINGQFSNEAQMAIINGQLSSKAQCTNEAMNAIRQVFPAKYIEQVNKMIECKNVSS